jgi:hypothetical protein
MRSAAAVGATAELMLATALSGTSLPLSAGLSLGRRRVVQTDGRIGHSFAFDGPLGSWSQAPRAPLTRR